MGDPVAVIQTRAKKSRETEMELVGLSSGRQPPPPPPPLEPMMGLPPAFYETAAAIHMFALPEEVTGSDSKFAQPVRVCFEDEPSGPLMGQDRGVGGVVEVLKAKYGCGKGQRLRVIGETDTLLQFEDGKTAPKNHEDKGWKWVLKEGEGAKACEQGAKQGTALTKRLRRCLQRAERCPLRPRLQQSISKPKSGRAHETANVSDQAPRPPLQKRKKRRRS